MIHLFFVLFFGFKHDTVSAEVDLGTVLTCLPTHMRIEVNRTKNPDLVPQEMHLNEPNCTATEFNDTFVLFEIPLDGCGTIGDGSNPDYLLFSNTAQWDSPGQPITFARAFKSEIMYRKANYFKRVSQYWSRIQGWNAFTLYIALHHLTTMGRCTFTTTPGDSVVLWF